MCPRSNATGAQPGSGIGSQQIKTLVHVNRWMELCFAMCLLCAKNGEDVKAAITTSIIVRCWGICLLQSTSRQTDLELLKREIMKSI